MGKSGLTSFKLVSIPMANAIARQNQATPRIGPDVITMIFRKSLTRNWKTCFKVLA